MDLVWYAEIHQTKTLNASTSKSSMTVGETSGSTATVTTTGYQAGTVDVNNNPATTTWSSDKSAVATVDSSSGLITAVGAGTANITVIWKEDGFQIYRTFPVTVTGGGDPEDPPPPPPPPANITGDFDITPTTINYRDSFSLKPKNIVGTNGCTYTSHQFRIEGKGVLTPVTGQNTTSTYTHGNYPYGIGVGSHQISMKVNGTCGDSGWLGPKTLTILGPADNDPPYFKLGWFANGDWTSTTSVPQVVQGSTMMVRIIETPASGSTPASPSDPDGDAIWIASWDFSNNAWTQSLPGTYGFHPQASYLDGIVMNTPGYHTIKATMTDEFGEQSTAQTMIHVIPPNPVAVITGPTQVKEGRALPTPFSSANSYSPVGRPIDHSKDEWTNKKSTYTTPGTEIIRLHVYDDQGRKSLQQASHTLTVIADEPPVAKLEVVPIGIRGQTYYVYNKSVSNDGDTIASVEYRMRYDANNNGFSDDSWTTLTGGNIMRAPFTPYRVGKYQLYVKATEDYGKTDDTLSDPLNVTTIDIQNQAPEVSFQIEGKNPEPDHPTVTIYNPQTMLGWAYSQVNSTAALPGKGMRWTAGTTLSGGLGKREERLYPFYKSYTTYGNTYQDTWFHPFSDTGFGANGLNPYRPIQTVDMAYSQPLLVPTGGTPENPIWDIVQFGSMGYINQYKTTRTHFYFQAKPRGSNKPLSFYAFNKSKIGRYEFKMLPYGDYEHRLLDGSPYDYILDPSTTVLKSPEEFLGSYTYVNGKQVVSFRKKTPQDPVWYRNVYFKRTLAYHATDDTVYQLNEWNCSSCRMVDGSYEDYIFYEIRTYDLETGEYIESSLEHNVFFTDFYYFEAYYHDSYVYSKGDNAVFNWDRTVRQFNRQANLVLDIQLPAIPVIEKSDPSYNYRCSAYPHEWYFGLDGEMYRYEEYRCYGREYWKTSGSYEYYNQMLDETHLVRYNPDYTVAWRLKLKGRQMTPRESFSWKWNGGGFDDAAMVVNPFRNEIMTKTFSSQGWDSYEYVQTIDMTTGQPKGMLGGLSFTSQTKNFQIEWSGAYSTYAAPHQRSRTLDNRTMGPYYNGTSSQGRVINTDGTTLAQYTVGGTLQTSYMYATSTDEAHYHELIGDGLALTFLNSRGYQYVSYDYIPWLTKGTPTTDPAVGLGFTLGQLLSPFNLSNHEMSFTLELEDADADRDLVGFSFRAQNARSRYALETDGATLFLSKYVNGVRTVLQQTNYPFADDVPVSFRIKTLGTRIEVFVNGAPYFDKTDSSWTSGKIGPFSNKSYVDFGSVSVKEVKAPQTYWDQDVALWDSGSASAEVRYSNIVFTDPENDPAGPYRWKYVHTPKFIANQGTSTLHNKTYSSNQLIFDKVGIYDVTMSAEDDPHPSYLYPSTVFAGYRKASNEFTRRIIVHRKPVAAFTTAFNADDTIRWSDTSYDPDRWASSSSYSPTEDGKNYQATRGIFDRKYYYISPSGSYVAQQLTRPTEAGVYRVGLAVMDEYGAWSDFAERTITVAEPLPPNAAPVATMTSPAGTQASPTASTDRTPTLTFTQTDADAGTVFRRYQIQVANETNTTVYVDTGELSQNTTSTSVSWTPSTLLPTTQKLRVRARTNDGLEWSAWSTPTWIVINNAPTANVTYPTGTQTSPTRIATRRPTITWTQTDPDTDAVFQAYEVIIANEANTSTIETSGQTAQNTTSTSGSWTVPADLPLGKFRVRVRVYDGQTWSAWSADRWLTTNTLPVAAMTFPSGTQSAPTASTDRTPTLQWSQTDADPGTVFRMFQLQVTNEANTTTVLDSSELNQNTSSTTGSWTPTTLLPSAQKLRVRARTNDGMEWSAWSAQRWILINNAPAAGLTYPTGTQANPTILTTKRPTIAWTQTDPDTDAVFRGYEVEIINEANTLVVASSGQVSQNTASMTASWTVPADLPSGKLRVRVRVSDGAAWSPWSAVRWMIANRPPVADFAVSPALIYESDDVTLTNASSDPEGDALTYVWTITRPDGSTLVRTTTNVALTDVQQGVYDVRLRATDPSGAS
ncbi:PKD domain-containing protein, partial [Paenibacillus sp.]|uniref:glycoside hydrolase family 78 protein n=1 Tax=Paenibacillus sp. TaxID=58172 RepID=UPI002D52DFCC